MMTEAAHTIAFLEPIVLLAAAVLVVPVAKRLGLGSVLGYIAAGIVVGPSALGLFREPSRISGIAELGIALLLFIIGLELNLRRLWSMRRDIFGLGSAQVVVSGALLALYSLLVGEHGAPASIVAGLGLALSSTAIVMQLLQERGEVDSPHGRAAFAVLLMQNLAIVPLIALVGFLSPVAHTEGAPAWQSALTTLVAVAAVILTGRYALNPLFRLLAVTGSQEVMTAAALLVVLGAAGLMALVGLSMAAGAFLAGLLLAESSYRHELEANIEPFRGLLLGLFFLSVGMSVNLGLVAEIWPELLLAVAVLFAVKIAVVYALARIFGHDHSTTIQAALLLSQGGEFGFVLYSAAASAQVMTTEDAGVLVAVVTLSMILTPLVARLAPLLTRRVAAAEPVEDFSGARGSVLLIGFGRVGQVMAQILLRQGVRLTIIDTDVEQMEAAARFGARVYYGDGTRLEVLRAAGAERVRLIAVCTDREEVTDRIVALLRASFPETSCVARSFDRRHSLRLLSEGVTPVRETFEAALDIGREALLGLGMPEEEAAGAVRDVRVRDEARLQTQLRGDADGIPDLFRVRPEPLEGSTT